MNNPTVAEVIAAFRRDRINMAYRLQQKADSLPGMSELRDKKKKLLQKILAASLNDTDSAPTLSELAKINRQEEQLMRSLPENRGCDACGDTGFVDGHLCTCLRDKIYREAYGALDIPSLPEGFDASDRSKFSDTFVCKNGATQQKKYGALENYAKKFAQDFPNTQAVNLLFTGNTGLGKTFLLRSIAKSVHQKGGDVMLISASSLFSNFHQHRLGGDINLDILQNCGLLMIDDLGVEPFTQNVTVEYFLELLNVRIDKKKHTVIATNMSADHIKAKYGERVYSRIRFGDMCSQLVFEGIDIRIK